MPAKEEKFVKVCPNCFSDKISFWYSDAGMIYNCLDCKLRNLMPLEFTSSALKKIREKLGQKKN